MECGFGAGLSKRIPDLADNAFRPAQDVSACESVQPDIRQQEAILAAVVLNEAGPMCLAVVLESQSLLPVKQVRASDDGTRFVTNGDLDFGSGKSVEQEQHPQACFHRRLCVGFGEFQHPPRRTDALSARAAVDPSTQVRAFDQALMERHVGDNDGLDQAQLL